MTFGLVTIFRQPRIRERDVFSFPSSALALPKADEARRGEEDEQREITLEKGSGAVCPAQRRGGDADNGNCPWS